MQSRFARLVLAVAIGVYVFAINASTAMAEERGTMGPSAGGHHVIQGYGEEFRHDLPQGSKITSITVQGDGRIDSIVVSYEDSEGGTHEMPKIGKNKSDKVTTVTISSKEELIGLKCKAGIGLDSVVFVIRNNAKNSTREVKVGGDGGDQVTEMVPGAGHPIVGLLGNFRGDVTRLGIVYVK